MTYPPGPVSRDRHRHAWLDGALLAITGIVLGQVAGCSVSSSGISTDVAGNDGTAAASGAGTGVGGGGGEDVVGGEGGAGEPTGGTVQGGTIQGGAGQGGMVGGGGTGGRTGGTAGGGAGGIRQGGAGGVRQGGAGGATAGAGGRSAMGGTAGTGAGGSGNLGGRGTLNAPISEGTVTCGAMTCDRSQAICCQTDVDETSCTLSQDCDGTVRDCDGPEDCNSNQVCCGRDREWGYNAGCTPKGNCPTQMFNWAMFCHNSSQCHNMEVCCPTSWTEATVGTCRVSCLSATPL